jgi:predicted nuclease with TOPRIM domain
MDIILTKNERMEKLEKRLRDLEMKMDRGFSRTSESFETFKDFLQRLQNENAELKKDRDFLLGKYKELVQGMGSHLSGKLRQAASENTKLIKDLVLEDMDIMPEKKGAGDLLGMIIKKKKLTAKSASKELGVRESKVKLWALRLKSRGLIDVNENERFEMTKK